MGTRGLSSVIQLAAVALVSAACGGGSGDNGRPIACGVPAATGDPPTPLPPPNVAPCDAQGWCWESPLPFRDNLGAIWHRTDQTIIASSRGHVLRLRDGAWRALPALPKPDGDTGVVEIHDLWAAGDNIYVAGDTGIDGMVWVYDGGTWATYPLPDFNAFHIWGTREREVMVVGSGGARLFSGGRWTDVAAPRSLGQGLWGCDDSYFAGLFGPGEDAQAAAIARYRNGNWSTLPTPDVSVQFSALSGAANDDVFASGIVNGASRNIAWHFDGTAWTDLALADSPGLLDIVALGGGQALAAGVDPTGVAGAWRWDGAAWTASANDLGMLGLSAATAGDILGRTNLNVHQFDGVQWTDPFPLPLEGPVAAKTLTGIWGGGGTIFLIAADGSIFQRASGDWTAMAAPAAASRTPNAIWGASPTDVFVVGSRGLIWHWDGAAWSEMMVPAINGTPELQAVWGAPGGPVYAVGDSGEIYRHDGTAWTLHERVGEDLVGVWGASANDVWTVGVRGRVYHFDGAAWGEAPALGNDVASNIEGIWGSGPNQIFAVGGGSVWRYDGTAWTETPLPRGGPAMAVWGRAANDVYVVGNGGMAYRYDGVAWIDIHAEHAWKFNAIWGDAAQIRAVGDLGTISVR